MSTATMTAELPLNNYTGSLKTYELVKRALETKFNKEIADSFNPASDARTFKSWLSLGYIVNKGQTGIRSFIMIKPRGASKDSSKLVPKNITLFHRLQVSPINSTENQNETT